MAATGTPAEAAAAAIEETPAVVVEHTTATKSITSPPHPNGERNPSTPPAEQPQPQPAHHQHKRTYQGTTHP